MELDTTIDLEDIENDQEDRLPSSEEGLLDCRVDLDSWNRKACSRKVFWEKSDRVEEIPSNQAEKTRREASEVVRYQRIKDIEEVPGFIVNIHDATNFDIELEVPIEVHDRYRDVITNQYTYFELPTCDLITLQKEDMKIGTTYRCRLRGVGIDRTTSADIHTYRMNLASMAVQRLIDRANGWVLCTLSDVDVYRRLLVDIKVPIGNNLVDIREYLLNERRSSYNDAGREARGSNLFHPYISRTRAE